MDKEDIEINKRYRNDLLPHRLILLFLIIVGVIIYVY